MANPKKIKNKKSPFLSFFPYLQPGNCFTPGQRHRFLGDFYRFWGIFIGFGDFYRFFRVLMPMGPRTRNVLALLEPSGSDRQLFPGSCFGEFPSHGAADFGIGTWGQRGMLGGMKDFWGGEGFLGWRRIFGVMKDFWGDEGFLG